MRKRFTAVALALCLMLSLLPVQAGAADIWYAMYYPNYPGMNPSMGVTKYHSDKLNQKLYEVSPYTKIENSIVTSYTRSQNGGAPIYPLTCEIRLFCTSTPNTSADQPGVLFAQWTEVSGNYVLYLGLGTEAEGTKDDYFLADNLLSSFKLADSDTFKVADGKQIIGWSAIDDTYNNKYTPGQEIVYNRNYWRYRPVIGYNYITYHYYLQNEKYTLDKTVFYQDDTGSIDDENFKHGESLLFCGWNDAEDGTGNWYRKVKEVPVDVHELYAQYQEYPDYGYCILHTQGEGPHSQIHPLDENGCVGKLPIPTYKDHNFIGWFRDDTAQEVKNGDSVPNKTVISAAWTSNPKSYVITLDPQGGVFEKADADNLHGGNKAVTNEDGKLNPPLPSPNRTDSTFLGWFDSPEGDNNVEDDFVFTSNTTLYAHWSCTHREEKMDDVPPTCGNNGTTGGKRCSVCGTTLEEPTVVLATGKHTPGDFVEEKIITEAICTQDGSKDVTYKCTVCGQEFTQTETIPPTGHTWGAEGSGVVTTPATCTNKGTKTFTKQCTAPGCGAKETRTEDIDPLPHTEEIIPEVPATCTTDGKTAGKECSACHTVLEAPQVIPAAHTSIEPLPAKDATCEAEGLTEGEWCKDCKEVLKEQRPIKPLEHDWVKSENATETVTKEPTCTDTGEKTITGGSKCSRCSATTSEEQTVPIPSNGHDWGDWTVVKEPTATEKGSAERECSVCQEKETKELPTTGEKPEEPKRYSVTFDSQGGSAVSSQTVTSGSKVAKPTDPTYSGHIFGGWFQEAACTNSWSFDTAVSKDITLYAKWTENSGTPDPDQPEPDKPEPEKPSESKTYTVTFNANGGSGGTSLTTGTDGKLASLPGDPTRSGYTFDGWYTSVSGGDRITTSTAFTQNTTVYAHWSQTSNPVTPSDSRYRIYAPDQVTGGSLDVSHGSARVGTRITLDLSPRSNYELDWLTVTNLDTGRRVRLTERRSDTYTFTMPSSDVEVELAYYRTSSSSSSYSYYVPTQPQARSGPTSWYYKDRHIYHFTSGLVPDSTYLTRDMLISVLYNLTDHSLDSATTIGSETTDSMLWASGNNILPNVYVSGLWGVDKPLSREQAAMLIFHYAKYRGRNTSQTTDLTRYADSGRVRPIAQSALSWTAAAGLIPGASASKLSPQDHLTCGEAGDILYRFLSSPT